ncbi:hypothetical protein ACFZCY_23965 [Streptomyces sp. NPDC007983]|uniref:hypothetical protein n=1 Tax=Streptomyces sp. NPDC007983 TaxID=3364800 RepID=UPI0036EB4A5C
MTSQVCARCQRPTNEPVVVTVEHGGSVGGGTAYACPGCAPRFPEPRDPLAEIEALCRARGLGPDAPTAG